MKFAGAAMAMGLAGCSEDGGSEDRADDDGSDGGSDGGDGSDGGGSDGGNGSDGGDGGSNYEVPEYADWLTTTDAGGVFYVYMDWEAGDAVGADGSTATPAQAPGTSDGTGQDTPDDPMLGLPMSGAFVVAFGAGLGLAPFGLGGLLGQGGGGMGGGMGGGGAGTEESSQLSSRASEVLFTNSAIVLIGDIDPDEIDERLTSEPESMFAQQFEAGEEIAGYTVYEPVESTATEGVMGGATGGSDSAIAVGDGAVLFRSSDEGTDGPVEALRGPIETAAGERTRATDEIDDFAWLLANGGNGDISFGGYGQALEETATPTPTPTPDDGMGGIGGQMGGGETGATGDGLGADYAVLEDANGIASSLTVGESSGGSGEFAGIVPDADESALRETLGSSAAESSVEIDGERVTATATWDEIDN